MEYLNILDKIDSHEEIGETWIEALIRAFNFPNSPRLFHTLVQLNNRVKEVIELYDSYSKGESSISSICNCSLPPIFNVWYFTTHFPIEKTRVVIILRTRTENSRNLISSISPLPTPLETHWSKQGVFLVRSYVSPECQQNDHNHNAWRVLTDTLIEYMANNNPDVLFVLVCQKKKKNDHQYYHHNTHNPLKYLEKDSRRFIVVEDDDSMMDDEENGAGNDETFKATLEKKKRLLFNLCQTKLKEMGKAPIQWEI